MTYMFILKCALKLVEGIILYYDARSKKHQIVKSRNGITWGGYECTHGVHKTLVAGSRYCLVVSLCGGTYFRWPWRMFPFLRLQMDV